MDVQRNARDLVGWTIAMTISDNSPLENLINGAASSAPLSPNQQQTVAAGMTYAYMTYDSMTYLTQISMY